MFTFERQAQTKMKYDATIWHSCSEKCQLKQAVKNYTITFTPCSNLVYCVEYVIRFATLKYDHMKNGIFSDSQHQITFMLRIIAHEK